MDRTARYVVALLLAGGVTGLVTLTSRSTELLVGIFGTYAMTIEICLRYPVLIWGDETSAVPSGVFGGGAVFGGLMLADGLGSEFNFAAAMLGLGLAAFGLATGYWMADSTNTTPDAVSGSG
jgi:hypothetical protein